MIANRIAFVLGGLLSWITLPIALITNLGGGCIVAITFGLILLPLSLIWMVFMGLLLGISWLWERVPWPLQVILAIPGIPIAAVGYAYTLMIPEPGEPESRKSKILLCQTFPFEMDLLRYRRLEQDGREKGERTLAWEALYKQVPLDSRDPSYGQAMDEFWRTGLAPFGLDEARYNRIANLLVLLGERG